MIEVYEGKLLGIRGMEFRSTSGHSIDTTHGVESCAGINALKKPLDS
jgi:hypothetical protein